MKIKRWIYLIIGLFMLGSLVLWTSRKLNTNTNYIVGQKVDSLNGVFVYYNSGVANVSGRNTTADGYNLGLQYQCVEFVKRYYYEHLYHKMPDSYGHAKSFYDNRLSDGMLNKIRGLIQYSNSSQTKPKVNDLLVFDGTTSNIYGHVAIISKATDNRIEIIQQNPGRNGKSRATFTLDNKNGEWKINNPLVLGWLRKE